MPYHNLSIGFSAYKLFFTTTAYSTKVEYAVRIKIIQNISLIACKNDIFSPFMAYRYHKKLLGMKCVNLFKIGRTMFYLKYT